LAVHLHWYGYSQEQIGVAYGIPAILYATMCPFMYLLTQRMKKRGIILIGFIQITIAMLMIGGSDSLFEFQKQPVFIFVGLCLLGLSAGMITIPVLPEMLEAIEEDQELSAKYDLESIENYTSGLFIAF
jgi:sugar phosphate permease